LEITLAKTLSTTPKGALIRATLDEIDEETRAHRLRAVNFRYERRLHDIESRYFEDQCQARADYMREIAEITGEAD
jgi:hypothetical protein